MTEKYDVLFEESPSYTVDFTELQSFIVKVGADVTHSWNGTRLTVTSASGTSSADLKGEKGDKGETGENGTDGFSPFVTMYEMPGGHRLVVTDAHGDHYFDIADGTNGSAWCGEYNSDVTYKKHSVVKHSGKLYICIVNDATGLAPDVHDYAWELIAAVSSESHLGEKKYSFGVLSDVHISQYATSEGRFTHALEYLVGAGVDMITVCGDIGTYAETVESDLAAYKTAVDTYAGGIPVYAISGNHDGRHADIASVFENLTGNAMYYSVPFGDDVFIMVGTYTDENQRLFTAAELQWLYETLEANRNKRCFLFNHVRPDAASGNALGTYTGDMWNGTETAVFESLLRKYPNTVLFTGHTHLRFEMEADDENANYGNAFGIHDIHIPSVSAPRYRVTADDGTVSITEDPSLSQGYICDVYENHIVLRAIDFITGEELLCGSRVLDTTKKWVESGTYEDSTGTVDSSADQKYVTSAALDTALGDGITETVGAWMEENSEPHKVYTRNIYNGGDPSIKTGTTWDSAGTEIANANYWITGLIPCRMGDVIRAGKNGLPCNFYYAAEYNADGTFLVRKSGGNVSEYTVTNGNTDYVKLSFQNGVAQPTDAIMVTVNDENLAYEAYGYEWVGGFSSMASKVTIEDAGGHFTGSTVEEALAEMAARLAALGA